LSSLIFKPLLKKLEICEEIVMTLERALPNDEHKVRKVEQETLQQLNKFMGILIKEIGAKHVVQLVVSQMLQIDEEREKIYTRQAATQDV
jgi:hypothetical protein